MRPLLVTAWQHELMLRDLEAAGVPADQREARLDAEARLRGFDGVSICP